MVTFDDLGFPNYGFVNQTPPSNAAKAFGTWFWGHRNTVPIDLGQHMSREKSLKTSCPASEETAGLDKDLLGYDGGQWENPMIG